VDGSSLALLGRRARRGGGVALLGALLGPALFVTPTEAPITHLVLSSLGLEVLATRPAGFSHKILDHIDDCSVVTKMLAR
jgi:hypothetical protein